MRFIPSREKNVRRHFGFRCMYGLAVLCSNCSIALAVDDEGPPRLLVDTSVYPYLDRVERDTDFTMTINANLPNNFYYSSFTNLTGTLTSNDIALDRSEQNVRWRLNEVWPVYLSFQAVFVGGSDNNYQQLGIGWQVHETPALKAVFRRMNLIYTQTFQLKQFNSFHNSAWEFENFFLLRFPHLSQRLYLSGFVDIAFDMDLPDQFPDNPIVAEVQAGMRIWRDFYLVTEYRLNEFRMGSEHNLAIGIEYQYSSR